MSGAPVSLLCPWRHNGWRITVEPQPDHAQYLAHWLNVLKADKRAIFTAASKAAEAVTYLRRDL
jgi:antirestriction protein ArdC